MTNDLSYDQRMQRICRSLSHAGYTVILTGFLKPGSVPLTEQPYAQKRLKLRFTKGKLFYLEYNFRLFWYLLKTKPDGVISIDLDTLGAGFLASRWLKKPLIFDAHEFFSELPEVVSRPLIRCFWGGLERLLCPRVIHNYTVSRSVARVMGERYGRHYEVFPNYPRLDATVEPPAEKPFSGEKPFVLYQGALNQGRGLEQAIEAFRELPISLHIAGGGDISEELRAQAGTPEQTGQVKFLGYLTPEQLRQYTARAWIGLNLLENRGLSYFYSLSNKFFDYLHAGIPQIAMDFPEYRAINDQTEVAVLIASPDPALISRAINALLEDPVSYEQLRQNCFGARRLYCWENVEPDLLAFYQKIFFDTPSGKQQLQNKFPSASAINALEPKNSGQP